MTWRWQRGHRGSAFGFWLSKPGYDVTTAAPGDFLIDTNSLIYQVAAYGDTSIVAAGGGTINPGEYTAAVGLPSDFAGVSNLMTHAIFYATNGSNLLSFANIQSAYMKHHIAGGVLYLKAVIQAAQGNGYDFRTSWMVYRAPF